MNHSESFPGRLLIACASIAVAIFTSTPILAQQKPMVIQLTTSGAATAVKAQTIIKKSGSYILNNNIVNSRAGVDSVAVTASNVTIDLQGFSITSTTTTTGAGINATGQSNVVIRNGIIGGFGGPAIISGNAANISGITATGNGSSGSGGAAIQAGNGSQILYNTVSGSGTGGISCGTGCMVNNNIIQGNAGVGITFSDTTGGYLGNILQGNNSGGAQVTGGTSLNQNLCNGVAC